MLECMREVLSQTWVQIPAQLYDLEQVTWPLRASVFSSAQWGGDRTLFSWPLSRPERAVWHT